MLFLSVIIWSVLVGVGIALHIFVVMMETGATQGGLGKKKIFALGAIFLGVQICMQTCGILLTWWIKQYLHIAALERIYKTVYVILLIWIGYKLFVRLRKTDFPDERKSSPLSLKQCAALSFRTSAEALLLGMTMYYYSSILSFFWVAPWASSPLSEASPSATGTGSAAKKSSAPSTEFSCSVWCAGRFSFKKKIPGK